jgi:hypothetical protein
VPVLPGDTLVEAEAQAAFLDGEGIVHLWDTDATVNAQFARALSLTGPGWDLYLLYRVSMQWTEDLPPVPTFWMHQLSPQVGADPSLYLFRSPQRLGKALDELVAP